MVGANENLNGSRDLTMPISGMVCHPQASTCSVNLYTKFEVSLSTDYENMKGDTKCGKWGVWGS